jgi:type III pantothenate kinase
MLELAADVGNTRIKCGICTDHGLAQTAAVGPNNQEEWTKLFEQWQVPPGSSWTLAGTDPSARDRLAAFLRQRGDAVRLLDDFKQLPLTVCVDFPERVGIDRLLNALAVTVQVEQGTPAVVIDAGTAVTVDLVDGDGVFRGGAILPGYRLMARALNDYTARLPLVESFPEAVPSLPGTNTIAAMTAGIGWAIRGGVEALIEQMSRQFDKPRVFLGGGDAALLAGLACRPELVGPFLTLEGIRLAARKQP